jgi:hypothetical protein
MNALGSLTISTSGSYQGDYTIMPSTSRNVHFGECLIHPIDCSITKAERYASWYTAGEYTHIKVSAYRISRAVIPESGIPLQQSESIRGLEKLQTGGAKMMKRKRNVLQSIVALQSITANPSDARAMEIKSTLERYVRKSHKNATEIAKSRAQLDYLAAQEIYKEVEYVVLANKQSDTNYSSVQHCHHTHAPRTFKQQSLAAVSA